MFRTVEYCTQEIFFIPKSVACCLFKLKTCFGLGHDLSPVYLRCSLVRSCVPLCGRGGGGKYVQRKNEGPSTLLKYVPTAFFLLPLAKLPFT
jgi:hypothetical protein